MLPWLFSLDYFSSDSSESPSHFNSGGRSYWIIFSLCSLFLPSFLSSRSRHVDINSDTRIFLPSSFSLSRSLDPLRKHTQARMSGPCPTPSPPSLFLFLLSVLSPPVLPPVSFFPTPWFLSLPFSRESLNGFTRPGSSLASRLIQHKYRSQNEFFFVSVDGPQQRRRAVQFANGRAPLTGFIGRHFQCTLFSLDIILFVHLPFLASDLWRPY